MSAARYAELHCRSNFTFLEGSSHPEELVERAVALGLAAVALTDRDGLYGAVRFAKAAKNTTLGAICGAELTLEVPELRPKRRRDLTPEESARQPRLVLLAEDERGYANLASAISIAQLRGQEARRALAPRRSRGQDRRPRRALRLASRLAGRGAAARRRRGGARPRGARCATSFPAAFIWNCSTICAPRTRA